MVQGGARLVELGQRDLGRGHDRAGSVLGVGRDLGLVRQERRHRRPLLVGAGDATHAAQDRQEVGDRVARLLVGERGVARAPDAIEQARRLEQDERPRRRRVAQRGALDQRAGQALLGRRVAAGRALQRAHHTVGDAGILLPQPGRVEKQLRRRPPLPRLRRHLVAQRRQRAITERQPLVGGARAQRRQRLHRRCRAAVEPRGAQLRQAQRLPQRRRLVGLAIRQRRARVLAQV